MSDRARRQVTEWANDLLDMSRRNRALHFRKLKRGTLEFVSPRPSGIHTLIAGSKEVQIYHPPAEDLPDSPWTLEQCLFEAGEGQLVSDRTTRSDVELTLRNLDRQAQADLIDRGLESLYLCFGILRWADGQGEAASSPLLFVPVQLHRESPRHHYRLKRADGDAVLNPSLRVLLKQEYGIDLPEHSAESPADENLESLLAAVERAVRGNSWAVDHSVVLMRATFHKEAMYRDLLDNIDDVVGHDLVAALADPSASANEISADDLGIPSEDEVDEVAPPERSHLILDADASQRRAIVTALGGTSLVMDGPPGTGKSQTISNLIAELIAAGRSVLFVSEKIAALDVVAKRLKGRGLGDFLLELHSHKISRREVAVELGRSLIRRPKAGRLLAIADAESLRMARTSLTEYATAANRIREPLGRSVHWVLGRLAQLHAVQTVEPPSAVTEELSAQDVAALMARFEQLARVWEPAERGEMFEWRGLVTTDLSQAARTELVHRVDVLGARLAEVESKTGALAYSAGIRAPDDLLSAERLTSVCSFVQTQPATEQAWWSTRDHRVIGGRLEELQAAARDQADDMSTLIGEYGDGWRSLDPAWSGLVAESRAILSSLVPAADLPPDSATASVQRRTMFLRNCVELANEIGGEGDYLSLALGASARGRSLTSIRALAQLANAADSPRRPERHWAIPAIAAQVKQSIEVLTPLVEDYQRRHRQLADHFEPSVYDLDLRGLVTRFRDVHKGLRKLSKAYREDKRLVASVSRTKRADVKVRELLPEALELQQITEKLDEREHQDRELLGRYYRPRGSDLGNALAALEQLRLAAEILGEEYDPERVAAQLAGEGPEDLNLGARAQRVLVRLESWWHEAQSTGLEPDVLAGMSPVELMQWAVNAAPATQVLGDVLIRVTELRGYSCTLIVVESDVQCRARIAARESKMRAQESADAELLGCFAGGFETDIDAALRGLQWVEDLQGIAGGPISRSAAAQLHGRSEPLEHEPVRAALDDFAKEVELLLGRFDDSRSDDMRPELTGKFVYAGELIENLQSSTDKIDVWERFVAHTQDLRAAGWAAALDTAIARRLPSGQLVETLEKAMYVAWFDSVAAQDRVIAAARSSDLDATVEQFRLLDRQVIESAAEAIVAACNSRRPTTLIGSANVIIRESEKKRKHMPVRDLLSKAGDIAQAVKPCFMMSPLSVSQFIPPGMRFDAVIFDEASQIRPADAINCIYRGRQLVVAGDEKQLPPTSFFDRERNDESDIYDEEQLEDFESVLKLCKGAAGLPSLPLRWHYRSQHESLITFSNYQFYEGDLVTYPGAQSDGADLGVELFVVDGVYRRGSSRDNPIEAAYVVDRVFYHAEAHPDRTVGVVTFSVAQADMIERLLEQRRQERPEFDGWFTSDRLDGFFVKNLESVQGDERDIMVFSVGYGPDEARKLTASFGPLSSSGGWRRLNVAITRARRRVEVVASFRPGELNASGTRHRGVRELLRYLDYAERGHTALAIDLTQSEGDVESPLEASVLGTIKSWGYDVVPQVGTAGYRIDMGVRHLERPGEFMLGVECDGQAYHSSRVARDRDRLRQEVLEGLGWRLHRIWGPSWYRDRSGQEARLRTALEEAANGRRGEVTPRKAKRVPTERQHEDVSFDATPPWVVPYRVATVRSRTGYYPHEPEAFSETARVAWSVLEVEAPMHIDLLARRVADAFSCNMTRKVRKAVADAVLTLSRQQRCHRDGEWVWISKNFPIRVPRGNEDARRDLEHIPELELDGAIYLLLRDARSATEDELLTQVGRLFGVQRITERARVALEDSLGRLLDSSRIERIGDGRLRVAE
jgi:very-short-patch-repair endonuclease